MREGKNQWQKGGLRLASRGEAGRTAGEEAAVGIVGEDDLPGDDQFMAAGDGIDRFVVGNGFELEVLAGSAQSSLLTHHGGKSIGSLAFGALLLARLLAVLQAF